MIPKIPKKSMVLEPKAFALDINFTQRRNTIILIWKKYVAR
jgi:hypothetical protein